MQIRVFYDGWPLVHDPLSAAAWHLRTLLALNPKAIQSIVALPTEPGITRAETEAVYYHTHDRATWEQRILPRLAEEHRANLIHTTSLAASLLGKIPNLVSPAEKETKDRGRLGEALGRGGLARATILWPDDLPKAKLPGEVRLLPPVVHPEFAVGNVNRLSNADLPDEFLLVQGRLDEREMLQLLESWTWAAASIGEFYPLVFAGLNASVRNFLMARLPEFHVQDSVRVLNDVLAQDMPNIFRASTAIVLLGEPPPWGNAVRHALTSGKAIVAHREPNTEAIVGSAAYLIAPGDLRGLGAAMITVVVDEKARENLEESAQQRTARWSAGKFKERLLKVYEEKI